MPLSPNSGKSRDFRKSTSSARSAGITILIDRENQSEGVPALLSGANSRLRAKHRPSMLPQRRSPNRLTQRKRELAEAIARVASEGFRAAPQRDRAKRKGRFQ